MDGRIFLDVGRQLSTMISSDGVKDRQTKIALVNVAYRCSHFNRQDPRSIVSYVIIFYLISNNAYSIYRKK